MNRDEAVRYIQDQLTEGMSQDRVVEEMVRLGWNYDDVLPLIETARSTALSGVSVTPSVQVQPADGPITEKGKKSNKKMLVGVIVLAFFLIAGGAFARYSLTGPNPEDVLRRMMENNFLVSSFSVAVEGAWRLPKNLQEPSPNSKMNFNLSGDVDVRDKDNPKYSIRIKGDGGTDISLVIIDGEVVFRDKVAYLKVNPGTSFGPFSLNMIANQWFKFDPQNDLTSSSLISGLKVNVTSDEFGVTSERIAKIREVVKNTFFFRDITNLPSENVDEVSTYHYGFKPDMGALANLARNIDGVVRISSTTQSMPQSEIEAIQNTYASTTWEIWIGKRDYLLRKLFVTNDDSSMTFTLMMKNYGNVPEIIAPVGAKPIQEVLESLFSVSGSAGQEAANDAKREADIKQIQTTLEIYYSEHDKYPPSLNELIPKYLPKMPVDQFTNQPYQYQQEQNGVDYKMCIQLESTKTQKCVSSQF